MNFDLEAMTVYARALREAAAAEEKLVGNLMLESEAFGRAMIGRAERVESVIARK